MGRLYSLALVGMVASAGLLASALRSEETAGGRVSTPPEIQHAVLQPNDPREDLARKLQARLNSIRAITTSGDVAAPESVPVFSTAENFSALLSDGAELTYESPFWLEARPVNTQTVKAKKLGMLTIARR